MKYLQKTIVPIISVIISFVCIYFAYRKIDFNLFFQTLSKANYLYIILASILLYITIWIRALRWNIILDKEFVLYNLFKIQMIGYFANYTLPLRVGELLKSVLLGSRNNISKSYIFGTIVIERFLDMFILLLMISIALLISPIGYINEVPMYWYLLIVFIILCLFIMLFKILKIIRNRFLKNLISNFILAYEKLSFNQFLYSNLLGIVIWVIYWINVDLIFKAFGANVEWYASLLILIISSITLSIPSLPGALGTFHLAVTLTLSSLSIVDEKLILPFVTILHGYGYLLLTIIGFYYFIIDKDTGIKQLIDINKVK